VLFNSTIAGGSTKILKVGGRQEDKKISVSLIVEGYTYINVDALCKHRAD